MKRPTFNEKTEVKVIDKESTFYGKRGNVVRIVGIDSNGYEVSKPYSPENYPLNWIVDVTIDNNDYSFFNYETQLESVQHKFIDIDYIREEDIVLGQKPDGTPHIRPKNTEAFELIMKFTF